MKTFNTAFPYFPDKDIDIILKEIKEVLIGNKMLTMGENVLAFEKEFASYCNANYAIATNSCSSALEISLKSLNLNTEDEVIVPVQTFIATGSSVLNAGAKVIFCDVDNNFLMDFDYLKKIITDKTKAVIIVHFAGMISSKILEIRTFLKEKNIILIEDDAHAHGASFNNIKAGNIGDFGCFSFYSTKNITTGEGGMITTNNTDYYEQCLSIRSRGMDVNYKGELFTNLGSNYRVTEIQGILGRSQLKRLDEFTQYRNSIAGIYKSNLSDLVEDGTIRFQTYNTNTIHAYWRFIVFLNSSFDRNKIQEAMNKKGIKVDAPYLPLLHKQPLFSSKETFKNAEKLSEVHISLPIHMQISKDNAIFIANTLREVLDNA